MTRERWIGVLVILILGIIGVVVLAVEGHDIVSQHSYFPVAPALSAAP